MPYKLAQYALDCPDPRVLAEFYRAVTGWEIAYAADEWVTLRPPAGSGPALGFQRVPDYRAPRWPSAEAPQQAHLEFEADDLDQAEKEVLALGARPLEGAPPDAGWRVYADPVGHPFCLVPA